MTDKYTIDYQDSKRMWEFALENCKVADEYAKSRELFSLALKKLKIALAKAYMNMSIDRKIAEDKAYLVLAGQNEELNVALMTIVEQEGVFKGLEKVLETRASVMSFNQSLIKNEPKQ